MSAIAAQLTAMNGRAARVEWAWMYCATTSFPTPLSPVMKTLASPAAARVASARTCRIARLASTSRAAAVERSVVVWRKAWGAVMRDTGTPRSSTESKRPPHRAAGPRQYHGLALFSTISAHIRGADPDRPFCPWTGRLVSGSRTVIVGVQGSGFRGSGFRFKSFAIRFSRQFELDLHALPNPEP